MDRAVVRVLEVWFLSSSSFRDFVGFLFVSVILIFSRRFLEFREN